MYGNCVASQILFDGETRKCVVCGRASEEHVWKGTRIYTAADAEPQTCCSKSFNIEDSDGSHLLQFKTRHTLIRLYNELTTAPGQGETLKNRVVLVSSDGKKFYTHASIVCRSSPVLHTYYHGGYEAGKEVFDLPEADKSTVQELLLHIYRHIPPKLQLPSFVKWMKLAHFLQVYAFEKTVKSAVNEFKEQKLLTTYEWFRLEHSLVLYDCRSAQAVIYEDFIKADDGGSSSDESSAAKKKKT